MSRAFQAFLLLLLAGALASLSWLAAGYRADWSSGQIEYTRGVDQRDVVHAVQTAIFALENAVIRENLYVLTRNSSDAKAFADDVEEWRSEIEVAKNLTVRDPAAASVRDLAARGDRVVKKLKSTEALSDLAGLDDAKSLAARIAGQSGLNADDSLRALVARIRLSRARVAGGETLCLVIAGLSLLLFEVRGRRRSKISLTSGWIGRIAVLMLVSATALSAALFVREYRGDHVDADRRYRNEIHQREFVGSVRAALFALQDAELRDELGDSNGEEGAAAIRARDVRQWHDQLAKAGSLAQEDGASTLVRMLSMAGETGLGAPASTTVRGGPASGLRSDTTLPGAVALSLDQAKDIDFIVEWYPGSSADGAERALVAMTRRSRRGPAAYTAICATFAAMVLMAIAVRRLRPADPGPEGPATEVSAPESHASNSFLKAAG